jgi:hypothetical protein
MNVNMNVNIQSFIALMDAGVAVTNWPPRRVNSGFGTELQ